MKTSMTLLTRSLGLVVLSIGIPLGVEGGKRLDTRQPGHHQAGIVMVGRPEVHIRKPVITGSVPGMTRHVATLASTDRRKILVRTVTLVRPLIVISAAVQTSPLRIGRLSNRLVSELRRRWLKMIG